MRASTIIYNLARTARPGLFLLPANICLQVPLAIAAAGRRFRFVDVEPETLCMCPSAALDFIRERKTDVAGVVYARTYGALFDAADFFAKTKQIDPDILLIDDRCSCRPDVDVDIAVDANVDAVIYSTTYAKYIDLGWGGFGFLRSNRSYQRHDLPYHPAEADGLWQRCRALANGTAESTGAETSVDGLLGRWPGWLDTRAPQLSWTDYAAAVRGRLPQVHRHKRRLNDIYRRAVPASAWLGEPFNTWRFNIRLPQKDDVLRRIFADGLFASGHFRPANRILGGEPAPNAEQLHRSVVNLFNDLNASETHAERVAAIVARHIADHDARREAEPIG